jgi:hypothetical protein
VSLVTTGYYAKDQQRFFNKLKHQLKQALHLKDPGERQQELHRIGQRLFKHLSSTAQSTEDTLALVWKVAKTFDIPFDSPQGRALRAFAPVGAKAVQGGLVGSTKG